MPHRPDTLARRLLAQTGGRIPVPVEDLARDAGWQIARAAHDDPGSTCAAFVVGTPSYQVCGHRECPRFRRRRWWHRPRPEPVPQATP